MVRFGFVSPRRFGHAAALTGVSVIATLAGHARAADVEVTSSTSTTINLDVLPGTTAHVAAGVTVNPPGLPAIRASTQPWSLTNDGSLSGANTVSFTKGGSVTNSQGATIGATTSAIILGTAGVGGPGAVTNAGTITGGPVGDTVALYGGGAVTNTVTGAISAANGSNAVSISGGTSRTVVNDGLISDTGASFATGVLIQGAGATNSITNGATGRIVGGFNGIFASATAALNVINAGSIASTRGAAIEATLGGTFVNSGTIASTNLDGMLIRNTASADITNSGTISGAVNAINFTATGGGATGAAHTLRLQTGSVLTGNVLGGSGTDSLILNGSGTESIAKFSNFELLTMQGARWTLTGSGTFSASATVAGGTLSVDGQMTTPATTVTSGGTLGGRGTVVGAVTIADGGTLSPGNSIGTITIAGNLRFVGAGNYLVEVSPTAADRTNVSGGAILAGTLRALGTGGVYAIGTRYNVLSAAGGLNGTFASLSIEGNFGATRPHIEYDANNVYLVLDPNALPLAGLTMNQRATAGAINTALLAGSQAPPFLALFNLGSAHLPAALDQLSGEVHATTASVLADESLHARTAILGRLRQASYGSEPPTASLAAGGPQAFNGSEDLAALAYGQSVVTKAPPAAPVAGRDTVSWAQGFGAWGRFGSDGNAAGVRRDLAGFISGVDTLVGSGRAGLAAGYTSSRNTLDGRGSANVETGQLAAYGGWSFGALNLRAGGAFAFHTIATDRMIAFPGFFDRAFADYRGHTGQIFGEAGYGLAFGRVAVEPFAGGAFVRVETDAAAERAMLAGLNFGGTTFESGYSWLGLRAASLIPLANGMVLIPRASAAWQHAFNSVTADAVLAFQSAPAATFAIAGVPIARDAALAEAGLDIALNRHATVGISYTGQLAQHASDHAAKGKFTWRF